MIRTSPARRWTAIGIAALTAAATLLVTAPAHADSADASGRSTQADAKGPIGWDVYRHLDRIDELTTGVDTHQFSSFDRAGGNDDGFAGTYSCLRTTAAGCVIADKAGAGEIESIWFTRDEGDVTRTGSIRIELDGKTVLDANLQDVVDGKLGAPFLYPFVANADQSSGGVYIKVPMPYRSSMRVTTTVNPLFYHVTYRSFADAVGVRTFDPTDQARDVMAAAKTWGTADPKPTVRKATTAASSFSLRPGRTATVADLRGSGQVDALRLRIPQITGPARLPLITDDGRAHKGTSTFTVKIDPANQGVKLTRRFDAASAQQVATITVDGADAGRWAATDDAAGTWSYQTVTLPASLTAGKSSVTVTNTFVSASIDWNEFHYWVDSIVSGKDQRTDEVDVGTSAAALASEKAHAYAITGQTWTGTPRQTDKPDADDPRVLASNALLRDVMVRVVFDGKTTVESPLGEFFGSGLTEAPVAALFYSMSTASDGWYSSWWPMPYATSATVQLVNRSSVAISSGSAEVTSHGDRSIGRELGRADARIGYFNATHHRADAESGKDWTFLDTAGRGRFVGVSHTMKGHIETGNIRDYLEGDERVYVDGSRSPAIHGTGTEDFYESGWYFNRREFTNPMNGLSAMPTKTNGCEFQCDAPYRLMIGDAVPFRSGITFGIEHGPTSTDPAEYSSTAYWYGSTAPASRITDTIDVGDTQSVKAHGYSGSGAARTVTATFEGDHDGEPVTDEVADATAPVSFTVAVDRRADAVVLRRTSLQIAGYQSAAVTVNGRAAGTWLQPLANATHSWLDDTFAIPPALSRDQRTLQVTLTPTAGSPAWSAASYAALSQGDAAADTVAPSGVFGLVATGTDTNAIRLAWSSASDDVAVHGYEVYASPDRRFRPSARNLVASPALPAFTHTGLGLHETWYYRVRAIDSSGNPGPFSDVASATTGRTLRLEGESLLPPTSATAPAIVQGDCCGVSWSGGAQLWFQSAKAGDTITVAFTVPVAGTYDASAVMTRAADYGVVQAAVDGTPAGSPFDGYAPTGVSTATASLGALTLTEGRHTLTLTITGRNPAATNGFAGLDVLSLALRT